MTQTTDFSHELRAATWTDHEAAEYTAYMQELLGGRLPREGYAAMVAQHYFAYVALERAAEALADDPVAGVFVIPELNRLPALEHDLAFLYGPEWPDLITASKPTLTYAARIDQIADWPGGFVAHHYTRYMGDLSGGQQIRRAAEQAYGLSGSDGVGFYVFDGIGDLRTFKEAYRDALNNLDVPEDERRRIVAETRLAYQLNTEVLADLGRQP
ncbi:biliverdin-producing heme oxygenase [Nonomuraea sp. NBC_01738]|uniref:biliverdin-producing heme oxygenase n=1 Tax=Nonomuraea sp. NBC_01738 TaxID=2976003 RepID=UPI002E0E95B5|nr:biliverdin-producing heme oxygenase [Nonomuraea sp. NBC_01738]